MKNIRLLMLCLAFMETVAYADSGLSSSYSAGFIFGQSNLSQPMSAAQNTPPSLVPGFQSSHPAEEQYANKDMKSASQQILTNTVAGKTVLESEHLREKIPLPNKNDPLVTHAKSITDQAQSIAQNASPFCINNECDQHVPAPPPNTYKDIASLSGIAEASKSRNTAFIFTGNAHACHSDSIGFNNCCSNSGWGQDLNLTQCNSGEQDLGHKKEAGLCHEIGEYCSHKFFGYCTEHKKGYCCFPSKLSKIIQEQGRSQIGRGWGSAKNPDCSGFSVEQLQAIDFGRIDFTAAYEDIRNKQHLPNEPDIHKRIEENVQQSYQKDNP